MKYHVKYEEVWTNRAIGKHYWLANCHILHFQTDIGILYPFENAKC